MEKVLVTGATGFIGLHCIKQLLDRGYSVNGTLRSLDRQAEVIDSLERNNTPTRHLSLFEVDLNRDSGWNSAIRDCNYVLHVASPFVLTDEDEDFFVKPAVEGVQRALKFSKKHNVKKVILTSSFAAIHETLNDRQECFNEEDWSNPNKPGISFYAKSKTMAELAAWEFMEMENPDFSLAVINPVLVMGPSLSKDVGTSNSLVKNMINGSVPGTPKIHIGIVRLETHEGGALYYSYCATTEGLRFTLENTGDDGFSFYGIVVKVFTIPSVISQRPWKQISYSPN